MENSARHLNEALQEELRSLEESEGQLERQMQDAAKRLDEVRRRRGLVEALLGMDKETAAPVRGTVERPGRNGAKSVPDIAYAILLSRGKKPMHYEELAESVRKAGGLLGGQTPAQTLIARITRDPRFVRPEKRGWYAASDFYPRAKSVGARGPKPSASVRRTRKRGGVAA